MRARGRVRFGNAGYVAVVVGKQTYNHVIVAGIRNYVGLE
jgi:hypothetical protein